jgi:hypothetical protein
MAISDSHRLGQLIGIMLERAIKPQLQGILPSNYFLDSVSTNRTVRGNRKKVKWTDTQGNSHDLDFVIEQNGTNLAIGTPKAFIECAWRRYTKHSKNKAQEIQGAIIPLAQTYANDKPFLGAILAGEFTAPSLQQLSSHGFTVLYISYQEIIQAYASIGIDVSYNEHSSLLDLKNKADSLQQLNAQQLDLVIQHLYGLIQLKLNNFLQTLMISLNRTITKIIIQPLYGSSSFFTDLLSAKTYLNSLNLSAIPSNLTFDKLFIYVEYSNGDNFRAEFGNTLDGLAFLAKF